jgi:hypothetical protein
MFKFDLNRWRGATIMLLSCLVLTAQPTLVSGAQGEPGAEESLYRYYFENDRFVVPYQEVVIDGRGKGHYRFKKKDMDEMTLDFEVSRRVLGEIRLLLDQLSFLGSTENYQHKKDFSHLGTMTLTVRQGGRERQVAFNYTDNPALNGLIQLFRGMTIQENRIFEIDLVRSTDPISMPAQLRMLEAELKSRNVADPSRFSPVLTDLRGDESVPLIARNHAERLLQMIEKLGR